MAELNKNVLTDEWKSVKEVIDKIYTKIKERILQRGRLDEYDLEAIMKRVKKEYKLIPQYDTLEEYINAHSRGAYQEFCFYIGSRSFECVSVGEFGDYYNPEILKAYVVVDDEVKDNGGNCENYKCVHKLTVKRKEDY